MRTKQRRANRLAELFDPRVHLETEVLEDNLARQRIPVACEDQIEGNPITTSPDRDAAAIDQRLASTAPTINPARSYSPSA